jgi:uncharacterized protein (DUF58 family)
MPERENIDGIYVSTDHLVALEANARDLSFVQKARSHQQLAGRIQSAMRGRGLMFEELRDYLPGDDIRSIDWRVTARTNKPVVRVYSEEKERPALVIVDQRINMFFGSRRAMKSVTAAEAAMLCAWRILGSGDRVGGFVFNDEEIDEIKPHRSRNAVIAFADTIVRQNRSLKADASLAPAPRQLDVVLGTVANVAHHDHLIVVISDFDGHTVTTRDLLLQLSGRNDVICILVYDPFLLELPKSATSSSVAARCRRNCCSGAPMSARRSTASRGTADVSYGHGSANSACRCFQCPRPRKRHPSSGGCFSSLHGGSGGGRWTSQPSRRIP